MASTDREIPKIMKKETMAVVEPARTKTWGGSQVWPPPSSSTTLPRLGSPVQSPGKDNKWEMIKDGVFAKNENYDKPVDALYAKDTEITELDKYLMKRSFEKEREYRRVQNNDRRALLRIARSRQLVANKRKLREDRMTKKGLMESYQEFKQALLLESDDPDVLAETRGGAGMEMDVEMARLLRDAKLGTGSVRMARPVTQEMDRAQHAKRDLAHRLEVAFLKDHHRSSLELNLSTARQGLKSRHSRQGTAERTRVGGSDGDSGGVGGFDGYTSTALIVSPSGAEGMGGAGLAVGGGAEGWDWYMGSTKGTSPRLSYLQHRAAAQFQKLWRGFALRTVEERADAHDQTADANADAADTNNGGGEGVGAGEARFRSVAMELMGEMFGTDFDAHNLAETNRHIKLLAERKERFESAGKRLEPIEASWKQRAHASRELSREQAKREILKSREQAFSASSASSRRSVHRGGSIATGEDGGGEGGRSRRGSRRRSSSQRRRSSSIRKPVREAVGGGDDGNSSTVSENGGVGYGGGGGSTSSNVGGGGGDHPFPGSEPLRGFGGVSPTGFSAGAGDSSALGGSISSGKMEGRGLDSGGSGGSDFDMGSGGQGGREGGYSGIIVPWGSSEMRSRTNTADDKGRSDGYDNGNVDDKGSDDDYDDGSEEYSDEDYSDDAEDDEELQKVKHSHPPLPPLLRDEGRALKKERLLLSGAVEYNAACAIQRFMKMALALTLRRSGRLSSKAARGAKGGKGKKAKMNRNQRALRMNRSRLRSEQGQRQRRRAVLARAELGLAQFQRRFRKYLLSTMLERNARDTISRMVARRKFRTVGFYERDLLRRSRKAGFSGAVGTVVHRVRKRLGLVLKAWRILAQKSAASRRWIAGRVLQRRVRCVENMLQARLKLKRQVRAVVLRECLDGSMTAVLTSYKKSGWEWSALLQALDYELKLLDPPPLFLMHHRRHGGGKGSRGSEEGAVNFNGDSGGGNGAQGRRLFRLLGVRSPSEPHPALVHLLFTSELHQRVLVPPANLPPSPREDILRGYAAAEASVASKEGLGLTKHPPAPLRRDSRTAQQQQRAGESGGKQHPTPMFPEIDGGFGAGMMSSVRKGGGGGGGGDVSLDYSCDVTMLSQSIASSAPSMVEVVASSSGAYTVVAPSSSQRASSALNNHSSSSSSSSSSSIEDASSTSSALVVYNEADPSPSSPSSQQMSSSSSSKSSKSVCTWSEAVAVTMTSTGSTNSDHKNKKADQRVKKKSSSCCGVDNKHEEEKEASALEAVRNRPKLKTKGDGAEAALARQKQARAEDARVHRHLPLPLWRLFKQCSLFFAACREEHAARDASQTALEERGLIAQFLERALELRGAHLPHHAPMLSAAERGGIEKATLSGGSSGDVNGDVPGGSGGGGQSAAVKEKRVFFRWLHEWETCPRCHAMVTHPTGEGKGVVDYSEVPQGVTTSATSATTASTRASGTATILLRTATAARNTPAATAKTTTKFEGATGRPRTPAKSCPGCGQQFGDRLRAHTGAYASKLRATKGSSLLTVGSVKDLSIEPFAAFVNHAALAFLCPVGSWRRKGLNEGSAASMVAQSKGEGAAAADADADAAAAAAADAEGNGHNPTATAHLSHYQPQPQQLQKRDQVLKTLWPTAVAFAKPLVSAWGDAGLHTVADLASQGSKLFALARQPTAKRGAGGGGGRGLAVSSELDALVAKVLSFLQCLDELIEEHVTGLKDRAVAEMNAPPTLREPQRAHEASKRRVAAQQFSAEARASAHGLRVATAKAEQEERKKGSFSALVEEVQRLDASIVAISSGSKQHRDSVYDAQPLVGGAARFTNHHRTSGSVVAFADGNSYDGDGGGGGRSGGNSGGNDGDLFSNTQRPLTMATTSRPHHYRCGAERGSEQDRLPEEPSSPLTLASARRNTSKSTETMKTTTMMMPALHMSETSNRAQQQDHQHQQQQKEQRPQLTPAQQQLQRRHYNKQQQEHPQQHRPKDFQKPRGGERVLFKAPSAEAMRGALASSSGFALATTTTTTTLEHARHHQHRHQPQDNKLRHTQQHGVALSDTMRQLHFNERRKVTSSSATPPQQQQQHQHQVYTRPTSKSKDSMFGGAAAYRVRPLAGVLYEPPR